MDAATSDELSSETSELGPLGRWERDAVNWLRQVQDEEGRRAQQIVDQDGKLVRPLEQEVLGPLGHIEKAVVDICHKIKASERERVRTRTLRPKDVDASLQGPLGRLEEDAVRVLNDIRTSERLRAEQSKSRGGVVVRPIDVPGPLGELEMAVSELFEAEKKRSAERQQNPDGQVVRPKDAKYRGPLGEAELQAYETIQQLNLEEMERLKSIRRALEENRPMEKDRDSIAGILERFVVGLFRGPQMLMSVIERVQELLSSEIIPLNETEQVQQQDEDVDDQQMKAATSSSSTTASSNDTDNNKKQQRQKRRLDDDDEDNDENADDDY